MFHSESLEILIILYYFLLKRSGFPPNLVERWGGVRSVSELHTHSMFLEGTGGLWVKYDFRTPENDGSSVGPLCLSS